MSTRSNIAILGTGRMGRIHALNVSRNPRANLKYLMDEDIEAIKTFRTYVGLHATCVSSADVSTVLSDKELDGVIIATPSDTHGYYIKLALEAGKPVLCEKPITTELETTVECYSLSERLNVPLLCGFHRRHDPSIAKVKDALTSGEAGQVRVLKTSCRDNTPPPASYIRSSGGIFMDATVHEIDVCSWMCGSKPISVFAQGHAFSDDVAQCDDFDQVIVVIKYENGTMSVNETSRVCPFGYDNRFEISCEKAVYMVDNKPRDLLTVHGSASTLEPRIHHTFDGRYKEAYECELDHFLDVVQGKCSPIVTKDEIIQDVRLVQLCERSAREGRVIQYTEV